MIYGVILEEYTVPKIVPINITILRGARRMRFSSKLRATYEDFAPILWELLTQFGYKKYLQRIYISVEYYSVIKSREFELPILIETMRMLKLAYISNNILLSGTIGSNQRLCAPKIDISRVLAPQKLYFHKIKDSDSIELMLKKCVSKRLKTTSTFKRDWKYIFQSLFPGCLITKENRLDLTNTGLAILRKIPIKEYKNIPSILDLRIKQNSNSKLEFIKSLPLRDIHIYKAICECSTKTCMCTQKQLSDYEKRNSILKINAWRNVVLFEPS